MGDLLSLLQVTRVQSVHLDVHLPVFGSCAGTESNKRFYQRILRITGPPAFTFRLQQLFSPQVSLLQLFSWIQGYKTSLRLKRRVSAEMFCGQMLRNVEMSTPQNTLRHRWGQVARVCPGVWQMPHVRGLLAVGGLSAVAAPVILLACLPPFPPPLYPPSKAPDRAKRSPHVSQHISG